MHRHARGRGSRCCLSIRWLAATTVVAAATVSLGACVDAPEQEGVDVALPTFPVIATPSGDDDSSLLPGTPTPAPVPTMSPLPASPAPTIHPGDDDMTPTPEAQPGATATPSGDDDATAGFPGTTQTPPGEPTPLGDDDATAPTPGPDRDGDGFDADEGDCDDDDPFVYPGAGEVCDGKDNDCDGLLDDNDPDAIDVPSWYLDADGDGYGDENAEVVQHRCEQPAGYADNRTDCDDAAADVHPNAEELCDGKDNDCDIQIDEGPDEDGDGFSPCDDCDDADPATYPEALETCDGKDNDCDGIIDEDVPPMEFYRDADGDGYGDATSSTQGCDLPDGYVLDDADCDDTDPATYPGALEACDGKDNDCDGETDEDVLTTWYLDYDGDGFGGDRGTMTACFPPTTLYVAVGGDCDDTRSDVNPGEPEGCDGQDHDCDGAIDNDADGDGYPDSACGGSDCNDSDGSTYPGAIQVCDDTDHDCDGLIDFDGDGDGYAESACGGSDCDDANAVIYPDALPGCDDTDHDCDGMIDNDEDSDGASSASCGGSDCNDLDPSMRPDSNGLCALGSSCLDILESDFGDTDGVYVVDPDGFGTGVLPFPVTCDMTTDGGGWTEFFTWDRETGTDDLEAFEAGMTRLFNDMGEFTDTLGPYLQWSDLDGTADVMAYRATVPVPNRGELRFSIHYDGQSMEKSGTFLFAEAGGVQWNLLCRDDTHQNDFSDEEWSYHPDYTCVDKATGSWTWQETLQTDIGLELDAVHIHSFHTDTNHGDVSRLYRLVLAVR